MMRAAMPLSPPYACHIAMLIFFIYFFFSLLILIFVFIADFHYAAMPPIPLITSLTLRHALLFSLFSIFSLFSMPLLFSLLRFR